MGCGMSGEEIPVPPLSEPQLVPCLFATGIEIEVLHGAIRLVGWVDLPTADSGMPERRIIARMVMPEQIARELVRDLRKLLARGGH